MNIQEIKESLYLPSYNFLRENPYLGNNLIMVGLGGSYAYGTNNDDSDMDIRGIATNSKYNILIGKDFEQIVDVETDTTIYSLEKIVKLLCSCNPNTIELLGLKPEHYLYLSPVGEEILKNKSLFLSRMAVKSFGGYANAQLRRLNNKAARLVSQEQQENHILKSIEHASIDFKQRYFNYDDDSIRLYIDKSDRDEYEAEIYMDINLSHYPLRDFNGMIAEMGAVLKAYNKIGSRNSKAISHNKLAKHMMHLVRLYLMCFDILEKGEINTYRDKDHDLLMSIRNGEYLDENRQPIPEFDEMVNDFEKRLNYDSENTSLPDNVDFDKINDLVASINGAICSD